MQPEKGENPATKDIPGPGRYDANYKAMIKGEPRPVFGSASRDKQTFYETTTKIYPGPGAYESKQMVGKEGKNVVMSARRPDTSP